MADDRIEVFLDLDAESVKESFSKVKDQGKKTAKTIETAFTKAFNNRLNSSLKGLDTSITKLKVSAVGLGRSFGRNLGNAFIKLKGSIFNARTAFIGLAAAFAGGAALRAVTNVAIEQQNAINALNVSLRSAGTFSEEASTSFQKLASSLQQQSVFGDEVILQQAALARNYTKTNDEAEKLISASVDLAAATGITLDTAVQQLGKTFSGSTGLLSQSIPALKDFTAEQLKAGAAVNLVATRFSGSALGATRTYSGALTQLSNTFGDVLEGFGAVIAESPTIVAFFNALSKTLASLTRSFEGGGPGIESFFKSLIINSAAAASAVIESFSAIAKIPTFVKFAFVQLQIAILTGVNFILSAIQPLAGLIDRVLGSTGESANNIINNFKVIGELEKTLEEIASGAVEIDNSFDGARKTLGLFTDTFQELSVAGSGLGGGEEGPVQKVVESVDKGIVKLREKVAKLQSDTKLAIENTFFNSESVLAGTPSVFESLAGKGKEALTALQKDLQETKNKTVQLSQQIGQAVNNGIANTISNSVAQVTKALASGEDAFGAFAKAALATIGDLAVQLGQTLIASGIGIEALKVLGGAAAIAAGVALVAVGTLIKGAAGGGSVNPSGGSSVTPPLADLEPDGVSEGVGDSSRVNVTIEGNVFDSEETGLRISDILKEQGFNNAVIS